MRLEQRLAAVIRSHGTLIAFTADDVTLAGAVAIDPDHTPNAAQNSIGTLFRWAAKAGYITATGEVVRSQAPYRKGGAIRRWHATATGMRWALTQTKEEDTP